MTAVALVGKRRLYSSCVKQVLPFFRPRRHLSLMPSNSSKFYELRTYTFKPAHFKEYLELTKEKFHLRTAHSKLYGFWVTELGGINEVNHLWEYDSFAHRTEVRQKLAADQVWIESYFSRIAPFLVKQDNAILMPSPLKQIEDSPIKVGGVYEICRYDANPGCEIPLMQVILNRAELIGESGGGKLMGLFSTDVGHNNSVYHLWNYESMDRRHEVNIALNEATKDNTKELYNHVISMSSKLMVPSSISPLK